VEIIAEAFENYVDDYATVIRAKSSSFNFGNAHGGQQQRSSSALKLMSTLHMHIYVHALCLLSQSGCKNTHTHSPTVRKEQ
jgi:hypothetical protein